MGIIRNARGSEISKQSQRVFLSYNGYDAATRDDIISDLLSMDAGTDCVVSCLENPDAVIDKEQLRNELYNTQLLVIWVTPMVIWVTPKMLQSITDEKWPIEHRLAQELQIPILPILNDDELFPLYEKKFGSIHCIAKFDNEYRIKLKHQMETSLVSKEIIRKIKEKAFTSAVFLSYRKHETSEARRFMKAFHDLEGFESISVWYDNFLTAGRNFDKDIIKSITNCNAFVLVVTPALATDGNYVQEKEYPFAQKIGKPIVAVEVVPTSQVQFSNFFPGTECPISLDDTVAIQKTFCDKLGASAFAKQLDSERAYLLGMAYLKGIDVERDFDRAVRLLSVATEAHTASSIDAANQLANIYESVIFDGKWTNLNFDKALQ